MEERRTERFVPASTSKPTKQSAAGCREKHGFPGFCYSFLDNLQCERKTRSGKDGRYLHSAQEVINWARSERLQKLEELNSKQLTKLCHRQLKELRSAKGKGSTPLGLWDNADIAPNTSSAPAELLATQTMQVETLVPAPATQNSTCEPT